MKVLPGFLERLPPQKVCRTSVFVVFAQFSPVRRRCYWVFTAPVCGGFPFYPTWSSLLSIWACFFFIFFFFFFFPSVSFRFRRSPLITKGNGEALWSSGDCYNCRRHYLTAIVPSPALFDPSSRLSTSDRFFLLLLLTKRSVVSAFIVERPALQDVSVSEFFFLLELKKNTENCLAPRKSDFTLVRTRVPTSLEELDVAVKHWPTFINVKSFERSSVRCSYWSNDGCCSM